MVQAKKVYLQWYKSWRASDACYQNQRGGFSTSLNISSADSQIWTAQHCPPTDPLLHLPIKSLDRIVQVMMIYVKKGSIMMVQGIRGKLWSPKG